MIRFFQNIRKSLLVENKTSKPAARAIQYFKYAIGEIILVVIGILLALQINTWNQNRLNAILEQELLNNLLSDIEIDIRNLEIGDSTTSLAVLSKNKIIDFSEGVEMPRDSVFYYFSKLSPLDEFIPTTITYDEMKNSEGFKVIKSRTLRREISTLYNNYNKLHVVDRNYNDSRLRLQEIRVTDFATASFDRIARGKIRDPDQVIIQIQTNVRFLNALDTNLATRRNLMYKETLENVKKFKLILKSFIKA